MTRLANSSIATELLGIADQRRAADDLDKKARQGDRAAGNAARELKKNYAELLSRALAQRYADALRPDFPGILPDEHGRGHESLVRASKKPKRLDVNYSNPMIGLGLGLSVKTLNFRDPKTQRYTKNFTRIDNEWRAEASDYHERQPYAVMVGVLFLPRDAADDARKEHSSFAGAVNVFRHRAGRRSPADRIELFERIFIGLYETEHTNHGDVVFFDVMDSPPKAGMPTRLRTFEQVVMEVREEYDRRNSVGIKWEDEPDAEVSIEELAELQEDTVDDDID